MSVFTAQIIDQGRFAVIRKNNHRGQETVAEYPIPPKRTTDEQIRAYFDREFCNKPYTIEQIITR